MKGLRGCGYEFQMFEGVLFHGVVSRLKPVKLYVIIDP